MGTIKDLVDAHEQNTKITPKALKRANDEKRAFKEVLNEELKKIGYQHTDQSSVSNHVKTFSNIIAPCEDIDNGQVYDIKTGITTKDL